MKKRRVIMFKTAAILLALVLLAGSLAACQGAPGERGERGLQGVQGIQGEKGDQGDQGIQGIQGEKGDKGDQGIQGVQGEKGDKGDQGIQGIQGEKGDKGDQGIQGIQGEKGDQGDQGIQGIQGEKGDKGDQGIQGVQGEKGDKGDQGIQGVQGEKGDKGDQGIQGIQGEKGDDAAHANERHTVTFDPQGGTLPVDAAADVTVYYGDVIALPIPTRENYTFMGWYTGNGVNDGKFTTVTPVTKTCTLYAQWKADTQYRLILDTNGGNGIAPQYHDFDEVITALPNPVKSGYEFTGWYLDTALTQRVGYPLTLSENTVLYAKWQTAYHYINFHTNSGTSLAPYYAPFGTSYTAFTAPDNPNYTFEGWYLDSGFTQAVTYPFVLESDVDLFAKWNTLYYSFSFVSNGGSYVSAQNYQAGIYIDQLPTPTRTDYLFGGWYLDGLLTEAVSLPYLVQQNEVLYAKWETDPYAGYIRINNFSDLQRISDMSANYILTADIDCENIQLDMLGTAENPFTGIFDGNGYSISNFTIYTTTADWALFAKNSGTIKNLTIKNFSADGTTNSSQKYIAGLCATNSGLIYNVNVQCALSCNGTYTIGGIAANNDGTINNCYFSGSIKNSGSSDGAQLFGGIAAVNKGGINNCLVTAGINDSSSDINSTLHQYTGGITSRNYGTVSGCVFSGSVTGPESSRTGAIVGYAETGSVDKNNYKDFNVTATGGKAATLENLNSVSFYTDTLGWDSSVWDLTLLDFNQGYYPKLYLNH